MTDRRYSEEEVAEIFKEALKTQSSGKMVPLADSEGMTLATIQDIGKEVGIPADLLASAANSVDRKGVARTRKMLGMTVGVGRTVDLGRKLSDEEWERLVVVLRETFDARGRLKQDGNFRQWTNGALHVLVEPTATGHQVRMQTTKTQAVGLVTVGLMLMVMAGTVAIAINVAGNGLVAKQLTGVLFLAAMGVGTTGWGALLLPGWVRERRKQMDEVAARLLATD